MAAFGFIIGIAVTYFFLYESERKRLNEQLNSLEQDRTLIREEREALSKLRAIEMGQIAQ